MNKNKKIIIIVVILISITLLFLWFNNKRKEITFQLINEEEIDIEYGEEYLDPGFIALNGLNKDISNKVTINGTVDVNKIDTYEIQYILNYDNQIYIKNQ